MLAGLTACSADDGGGRMAGGTGGATGTTSDIATTLPVTVSATNASLDGSATDTDSSLDSDTSNEGTSSSTTNDSADSADSGTVGASSDGTSSTGDSTTTGGGFSVSTASPEVIVHGGVVVISGSGFADVTDVTVSGVDIGVFSIDSDTQITATVQDTVPIGEDLELQVLAPEASDVTSVTVLHLVINEVDPDSPNAINSDGEEFVEIATGVEAAVSLSGYTLVLWSGALEAYTAIELDAGGAATSATGLLVVGSSNVAPDIAFGGVSNNIQNGEDALAIYQRPASDFAPGARFDDIETDGIIDAFIYESATDTDVPGLYPLMSCCGPVPVVDEGPTSEIREMVSLSRCSGDRRSSDEFSASSMTPGQANVCD